MTYRYCPSRHRRNSTGRNALVGAGVAAAAIALSHPHTATGALHHAAARVAAPPQASPASAKAIAFAEQQIGKPYLWGGTGPDAYDCSGLVMMAYRSAGVYVARTSQEQWATERHVSSPQPGDAVFYPGSDGTWTSPGHVALVIGGGQMIEAYGTGYPIREVPIRPGAVGYTDPGAS